MVYIYIIYNYSYNTIHIILQQCPAIPTKQPATGCGDRMREGCVCECVCECVSVAAERRGREMGGTTFFLFSGGTLHPLPHPSPIPPLSLPHVILPYKVSQSSQATPPRPG